MLSSAGWRSPQLRSRLMLAAVALAALAVSLLLAFVMAPHPEANGDAARRTTAETHPGTHARETAAETPMAATAAQPRAVSTADGAAAEQKNDAGGAAGNRPNQSEPSLADQPPLLWTLLTPWAFTVDAIALLGLAAVLIVRYKARRHRGARR